MNWQERIRLIGAIVYTTLVTLIFGGVCFALYRYEIIGSQRDIALMLFGALVVCFKDCGAFWTGSTASSQGKDATIAQIATNTPRPPGT
jgi:hypothetical protein